MSMQENTLQTIHVSEQDGLSARKQAQVDELLVQMHATTNPDELVVLAERLKLLAQHPADALHTFDESELPEWSIHEEDQENLDAFFNDPADRGKADAAFTIPRGASDPVEVVSGAANKDFTSSEESVLDSMLEPTLESKDDSEVLPAEQSAEALSDKDEVEQIEIQETARTIEEAAREAGEADQDRKVKDASRREDFARFHCIYESKDGQLALYEDEHGHLTAVNTNRFA